jgi:hypothetical protein
MRLLPVRSLALLATLSLATLAAVLPACGEKKGGLMLAIVTDLDTPKDISVVSVTIKSGSAIKHNFIGRVRPDGTVEMPGTIAIVEPDDPTATIRVRVVAFQERKPRVLRDIRTTVPRGGLTALLRVPLTFVNDGSATGELPAQFLPAGPGVAGVVTEDEFDPYGVSVISVCTNPNETVIDGVCNDSFIDSAALPAYSEEAVFGSEAAPGGKCFAADRCLAEAEPVPFTADATGHCTLTVDGVQAVEFATANLALATAETGTCFGDKCFVPIDNGPTGWQSVDGKVVLSDAVCHALTSKRAELYGTRGACPTKVASQPLCTKGAGGSPVPIADGAKDGSFEGGPSDGGAAEAGPPPQRVMTENFVSGIAFVGLDLYAVGAQGGTVLPSNQPGQPILTTTQAPGSPISQTPGPHSISAYGGRIAVTGPVGGQDPNGYVVQGTTALAVPFAPATGLPHAVAYAAGTQRFVWAVLPPNGFSGVMASAGTGTAMASATALSPGLQGDVTAVVPFASGAGMDELLFGTADGRIVHCLLAAGANMIDCGQSQITESGAVPIQAMRAFVGLQRAASFIQGDAVYRVDLGKLGPGPTFSAATVMKKIDPAGVKPFVDGPNSYSRGVVANDNCVFYTSQMGVQWAPVAGGRPEVLVDLRQTGGVALAIDLAPGPGGKTAWVYWSQYADLNGGGGVYGVPIPAVCVP